MKKLFFQFIILVALFFGAWYGVSRVDWMGVLRIEKAKKTTEQKLGEVFWKVFSNTESEIHSSVITEPVDSLVTYLCIKNGIDRKKIKLHILENDEVNAFTLPDGHIVIYTGLLKLADNEGEVMGVIGHEMAHMEKGHVMKKLVKEIGLNTLIAMTGSKGGGELIKKAATLLSSSAYDRSLESEADMTSVDYLLKADIDPEPFANFLYKMASEENLPGQVYWISTHPEAKERAESIIQYIKDKPVKKNKVLSTEKWDLLKERLKEYGNTPVTTK